MIQKYINKNTMYSLSAKGVAAACYFLLDILIARILGYYYYNEWSFYLTIITMLNWIVRFGIDSSIKVHVARSAGTKDIQQNYFIAGIKLQIIISVISSIILFFAVPIVSRIIDQQNKYSNLQVLLMIGSVHVSMYALLSSFKESSIGFLQFSRMFKITSFEFLGYLLFSLIGMSFGGLIGLAVGYAFSLCITVSICFFWEKDILTFENLRMPYPKEQIGIMKYAVSLFLVNIGGLVLTEMDSLFLGIYSNNEIGIYAIAKNLIDKATNIPVAICIGSISNFAIITKLNYKDKLKEYFGLILKYSAIVGAIIFLFALFGRFAIIFLYGDDYLYSSNILYLLLPYFGMYSITTLISSFLSYQKRGIDLMVAHIIMILSNMILDFLLIPNRGAKGAAIATDLSMLIFLFLMIICNIRCFKQIREK